MKNHWPIKRLADVCEIIMGQSPDGESYNVTGEGVPLINGPLEFSKESFGKTVRSKFTTQPTKYCKEGDLILCVRGSTTGRMNIAGFDACVGRGVAAIRAKQYQPWINHFISSKRDEIHGKGTGATFPNVSGDTLANFELVFLPLAEQQRIVGLLDEAFEGIATAKANAEKNLQNARALFESHLQSVFSQRGEGWVETKLGAEIDLLAGFAFKSVRYTNKDHDIRLLRGDNIIPGSIRWDDVKKWPTNDTEDYERYWLREGDVVLAMDRPWIKAGLKHATITAEDVPSLLVQRTARLRGGANLDNRFLKLLVGSSAFTSHILGVQTGIGVPHISGQQIKDFEFARPPVSEQRRLADNLESLSTETQRLTTLYTRKLAALEALKKSLLHQAFSGEL